MIKILYIGDICGRPGREAVASVLPELRKKEKPDIVVADVENLAHGRGATVKTVREVMSYGIDFMTAGNHIWRRPDYEELLSGEFPIIRAANYPEDIPGKGFDIVDLGRKGRVMFMMVQGRQLMNDSVTTDMLRPIEKILENSRDDNLEGIVLEIHAETTSEKVATALYFDGKLSAVVGTHTHVPTADERILPNGSAFISDIGMVGPMNSSLWVKAEIVQQQLRYPFAPSYDIEEDGERRFDAVLLEIDSRDSCTSIKRINKVL
ncbi:YmdB family metallophosphoesterase [Candidatus Dojkabacteria bacterium]|nr:YmdB family metallophosphoesterase [Candidatus Dojkabacteria bacterium]